MNTNPNAKTVLCFGDSNTWGQRPDSPDRFTANVRWPGKLQQLLGQDYYVIEEGMCARTTDIENDKPGRAGKPYLRSCILSHNPLNAVILMLGTNDLKTRFQRNAAQTALALDGLVSLTLDHARTKSADTPKIWLVCPAVINDQSAQFAAKVAYAYGTESVAQSHELPTHVQAVAKKRHCQFIDANTVAQVGEDGLHLDESSHGNLARVLAQQITAGI